MGLIKDTLKLTALKAKHATKQTHKWVKKELKKEQSRKS
jgi:hypothetical protein